MALATAEAIRDRIKALLEDLTPSSLSSTKFRQFRNEDGAAFEDWAEKATNAAFRRFQVREVGDDEPPQVSNLTEERVRVRFELRIAYPQTNKHGPANALDRDDCINADWKKIKYALTGTGGDARSNFTTATANSYDCTPLAESTKTRDQGGKIDYLVATLDFEYVRGTT